MLGREKYPALAVGLISLAHMLPTASAAAAASASANAASTCGTLKQIYKANSCCGNPDKVTNFSATARPSTSLVTGSNPCEGAKQKTLDAGFVNKACMVDGVINSAEQAGTNVTVGYTGSLNSSSSGPISTPYFKAGLCPVNVHWHLGTEHLSVGQYDENGKYPREGLNATYGDWGDRRLGGTRVRKGYSCHHYDANNAKFTTEYNWKHCINTHVGETYEIHWPHSAAGACGEPWQYQSPFYDGVFCKVFVPDSDPTKVPLDTSDPSAVASGVGVQAQVFTIINDEAYFYPDLFRGMIVNGDYGADMAYYTGSTTGTSRSNTICSSYAPITWQVDRKCHLISASSFDKMCADMMSQKDDMSADLAPTGARELVADFIASNQDQR